MADLFMTVGSNTMGDLTGAGCVMTINGVAAVVGMNIYVGDKVVITCTDGRMFFWQEGDNRNSTFFTITDSTGDVSQYFSFSEDYKTATLLTRKPPTGATVHWLTVQTQAAYTPTPYLYIIKQSDVEEMAACNVTATLRSAPVVLGKPVYASNVITFTAGGEAKFVTHAGNFQYPVYMAYNSGGSTGQIRASVASNQKTATLTVTAQSSALLKLVVLTYTGTDPTDGTEYVLSLEDVAEMSSNGVTLTVGGVQGVAFTRIKRGVALTATAELLREFYKTTTPTTASIYFVVGAMGDDSYIPFTLSEEDKHIATLTVPSRSLSAQPIIRLESNTQQYTPDVVGSNKVYKINNDILGQVNEQRFHENIDAGSVFDYGQYILSVIELPFKIDPLLVIGSEPIQLANRDLTVSAPVVVDDIIELDLGEIKVTGEFGDFRDYSNTVAILHLPRVAPTAIDLEYVINQTITIKYLVDVYTGNATVNIASSYIDGNIISRSVNLGVNIPFINADSFSVDNSNVEVGGDNDTLRPYIEIVRNPAILADAVFTIPVIDEDVIGSATGFITVEEVELKTSALQSEQSDIISKLNRGVILK